MNIPSPIELARFVKNQRQQLKLAQSQVGSRVNIKQSTISAFESHPENTKLDTVFRLLTALNLEIQIVSKTEASKTNSWSEEW